MDHRRVDGRADFPCADARIRLAQHLVLDRVGGGRVDGNVGGRQSLDQLMPAAGLREFRGECRSGYVDILCKR